MNFPIVPYNDKDPKTIWDSFFTIKNYFNDYHIDKVEALVSSKYELKDGKTGVRETNDLETSSSNIRKIAYITPNLESSWLYDLLFPVALKVNDQYFGFDIDVVTDPIHYVIYPENGGFLTWHLDVGKYRVNKRKISLTVQLSDPSDYEGGDFQIWTGGENFVTVPREKGEIIVFPSFLLHRVTPITKGQRKCLVFWVGGTPFR